MHLVPYPINLGQHSQTEIVDAINDLNARLQAVETAHTIIADVKRHTDPCVGGLGRFLRERIADFEKQPAEPGDDAAVDALCVPMLGGSPVDSDGRLEVYAARILLAHISAGLVPGLCDPRHVSGLYDKAQAEIAALKAKLARANQDLDDSEADADHWKSRYDALEQDKALCECENREKQAIIERFMESEHDLAAFADKVSVECGTLRDQADTLAAELAEAKALLRDVAKNGDRLTFGSWYHSNSHRFSTIVAAGGEVKP